MAVFEGRKAEIGGYPDVEATPKTSGYIGKVYPFTPPLGPPMYENAPGLKTAEETKRSVDKDEPNPNNEKTPAQEPQRRSRRTIKPRDIYTPSDYDKVPKISKEVKGQVISIQNEAEVIKDVLIKSKQNPVKQKYVGKRIDFELVVPDDESVKSTPLATDFNASEYGTKLKFENIPQVFLGKGDKSDKIKAGYTIFIDETGSLSWFNSVSQLIQEMIRRQGPIKSSNYNQKAKLKGSCNQKLDTLFTYLTWDCSIQVVAPKGIVSDIAVNYLGVEKTEIDQFLFEPQVAEVFYGLFAQMIVEPKFPEMRFFDFMLNTEVYLRACKVCGKQFGKETKPPSSYISLDIQPGLDAADHFESNRIQPSLGYCNKCHEEKIATTLSFEETPKFVTIHLNRIKVREDGTAEYIKYHVPIGGQINVNDTFFNPIAILSKSADTRGEYWSYLNRGQTDGEDQWYCIKSDKEPFQVDTDFGTRGIVMVVYENSGKKTSPILPTQEMARRMEGVRQLKAKCEKLGLV